LRKQGPMEIEIRRKLSAQAVITTTTTDNINSSNNNNNNAPATQQQIDRETGHPLSIDTTRVVTNNTETSPRNDNNNDCSDSEEAVLNQIFPKKKTKSSKRKKNRQQVSPRNDVKINNNGSSSYDSNNSISIAKMSQSPRVGSSSSQSVLSASLSKTTGNSLTDNSNGAFNRITVNKDTGVGVSQNSNIYFPFPIENTATNGNNININSSGNMSRFYDESVNDSDVPSPIFDEGEDYLTPINEDARSSPQSQQQLELHQPFSEGQEYQYSLPVSGLRTPPNAEFVVTSSASPSQMLSFLSAPSPLSVSMTPTSSSKHNSNNNDVVVRSSEKRSSKKAQQQSTKIKMSSLSENPIDNTSLELDVLSAR
jgi:hypothetical protein